MESEEIHELSGLVQSHLLANHTIIPISVNVTPNRRPDGKSRVHPLVAVSFLSRKTQYLVWNYNNVIFCIKV